VLVTAPYVHLGASSVLDLVSALTGARARGVDVRLLLGVAPAPSDVAALRSLAVPVAVMNPQRSTVGHAKGLVVDDTVVIASANLSAPGLSSAWEAALTCRHPDAAGYFAAALLRDWEVSSALTGAARLAPVSTTAAQGILEIA
jgi:phosphatidylserine/phosphatidylglycerophosphate/cardiolipin synthase-like enzyme